MSRISCSSKIELGCGDSWVRDVEAPVPVVVLVFALTAKGHGGGDGIGLDDRELELSARIGDVATLTLGTSITDDGICSPLATSCELHEAATSGCAMNEDVLYLDRIAAATSTSVSSKGAESNPIHSPLCGEDVKVV